MRTIGPGASQAKFGLDGARPGLATPLHARRFQSDRRIRIQAAKLGRSNADNRRRTKVRISTGTDVRLGGTYLLHVELSRKEIAQLFFDTHTGAMVRMLRISRGRCSSRKAR